MKFFQVVFLMGCLLLFGRVTEVSAQQDPMYTMSMWNMLTINPAYAGSRDVFSTMLVVREQWVGFDGAPGTQSLTLHTPLKNEKIGLGLSVVNDRIGPVRNTGFWGDFAYRVKATEKARLSFGIRAGAGVHSASLSDLDNVGFDDPAFQSDVSGSMLPNFGAGIYYYSPRGYIGISSPRLLKNEQNNRNNTTRSHMDTEERHYFLTAGYVFQLTPDSNSIMFKPAAILRTVEGGPVSFDLTANFLIQQKLWLGAAYRYQDSFSGLVSFQFTPQLRAGYSYDFIASDLGSYNQGTHEIMLSYEFIQDKVKAMSPRYF